MKPELNSKKTDQLYKETLDTIFNIYKLFSEQYHEPFNDILLKELLIKAYNLGVKETKERVVGKINIKILNNKNLPHYIDAMTETKIIINESILELQK